MKAVPTKEDLEQSGIVVYSPYYQELALTLHLQERSSINEDSDTYYILGSSILPEPDEVLAGTEAGAGTLPESTGAGSSQGNRVSDSQMEPCDDGCKLSPLRKHAGSPS